tara:strand:+ start:116 stop:520 length:405 start_codon:yes stop_codon:yes gene_type:complete
MSSKDITDDKLILQEVCYSYAKKIIESNQTLIPFGAFLNMQNEIIIEDPPLNTNLKENRIEYLSNKLNRLAYIKRIKVWIICFDGVLNNTESNMKDAICIEIHEGNQHPITNLYYPYKWDNNKVLFSEPISKKE